MIDAVDVSERYDYGPNPQHQWGPGASPAAQMREHLARYRAEGWGFRLAWAAAQRETRWPDTTQRREWRGILREQMPLWEAAYYGHESPVDLTAFGAILAAIGEDDHDALDNDLRARQVA